MKLKLFAFTTLLASTGVFASVWGRSPAASGSIANTRSSSWMVGEHTRGLTIGTIAPGTGVPIGSGVASGGAPATLGLAFFLSDADSLRFDLGLSLTKPQTGTVNFGFDLGFGYRTYRFSSGGLKGFTQPGFSFGKLDGGNGSADLYLDLDYRLGVEYFFNPNLSIGALTGLAMTFTNKFNVIQWAIATSAVNMSFYW